MNLRSLFQADASRPTPTMQDYPDTVAVKRPNSETVSFVRAAGCRHLAEIGIYRGYTSEALADVLGGEGELHLFDFGDKVDEVVGRLRVRGYTNVRGFGSSHKALDSYNWSLMRLLREHAGPIYDYVFIDGAHTWAIDALTFFLVDRLLKPGGFIDFDDYEWTLGGSVSLNPRAFPPTAEMYTEEQIESRQVQLIVDLLVRRDPRYEEVRPNKIFRKSA